MQYLNVMEFQKMIENQYKENEKRLNEEITQLTQELSKRNNIISSLENNLNNLNEKISKDELNYHFKEKEFENVIRIKERKLEELNVAVKQITKEATEEIKRLSEQLEDFQIKSKNNVNTLMNKKMNQNIGIKNDNININGGKDLNNLRSEIYILRKENNNLKKALEQKNNEIQFWKNYRNNMNNKNNVNKREDFINEMKIKQLERTLANYGNKIKQLNEQYKNTLFRHQNEKRNLLNQIQNLRYQKNLTNNINMNNINNYNLFNNNLNYNINDINNNDSENNNIMNDINYNLEENEVNGENDINNINNFMNYEEIQNLNEVDDINENDINNIDNNMEDNNQELNDIYNNEENDIKELQSSNDDINDEVENEENKEIGELPENINMFLVNRMHNNIPSQEAMRNEYINNELKKMPKSDYEEQS